MIRICLLIYIILFVLFIIIKNTKNTKNNEQFFSPNDCSYEPWGITNEACVNNCLYLAKGDNLPTITVAPGGATLSTQQMETNAKLAGFQKNCTVTNCEQKCRDCKSPKCLWINRYRDTCSELSNYEDCKNNLNCIFNRSKNKCEFLKPINESIDIKCSSHTSSIMCDKSHKCIWDNVSSVCNDNKILPKILKLKTSNTTTKLISLEWEYDDGKDYNDNYMVHYYDNSSGIMSNIQIINNYNKQFIYFYINQNQQIQIQNDLLDDNTYYLDKNKVYIFYVYAINNYGIGPSSNRIIIRT